jgi:peptidyl-prolyl cis-trans isomerase SurA
MLLACHLLLAGMVFAEAQLIDRVAISIGNTVITQSELLLELRLTAFLNGEPLDTSPKARRQAAERMVERTLIEQEMRLSRYGPPPTEDVQALLEQVRSTQFPSRRVYIEKLLSYGLSEEQLKTHLEKQLATLQFIDLRFRPGIQVGDDEIERYYQERVLPSLAEGNVKSKPGLPEVRDSVEQILIDQEVNRALDTWLAETRKSTRVVFREKAFE